MYLSSIKSKLKTTSQIFKILAQFLDQAFYILNFDILLSTFKFDFCFKNQ